ncbi:hypothetical protein Vretimale_13522 [Volvox reticuliferus]|uniref:Peptidase S8/S53 domain-containing protein n=1 Tax=Volvox reticuliferus TaxID=1737510 RepID=A0A8J4LTL3_9CHLO|nr:hypothetical protein Vretimale_13522 [Volvox reticuliferus]
MQPSNNQEGGNPPNPLYNLQPQGSVRAVIENAAAPAAAAPAPAEDPNAGQKMAKFKYGTSVPVTNKIDPIREDAISLSVRKSGFRAWVAKHPWLFWGLVVFGVLGVLTVIIVPSVCTTVGCKPKGKDDGQEPAASLRVIVRFTEAEATVKKLLPLLSKYFNSTKLASSALEVLQFDNPEMLKQVKKLLQDKYSAIVDVMLDDFVLSTSPTINSVAPPLEYWPPPDEPDSPDAPSPPGSSTNSTGSQGNRRLSVNTLYPFDDKKADPMEKTMWHLGAVNAAQAWAVTRGVQDVVVAVMDTGIDVDHEDLRESIWKNSGEIPGNGIDDDGNGYVDDYAGYDFAGPCTIDWRKNIPPPPARPPPPPGRRMRSLQQAATSLVEAARLSSPPPRRSPPPVRTNPAVGRSPPVPVDPTYTPGGRCGADSDPRPDPSDTGHGTHVAGIVAAVRGNGKGGSGLAPRVRLMALKVADPSGSFYASNIVAAYDYALRMGAHVVSNSFGPREPNFYPAEYEKTDDAKKYKLFERAVMPLAQKGVLLVAAAGNENSDLDRLRDVGMSYLPCTLELPNVLCVAASNNESRLWSEVIVSRTVGTNYGSMAVDIAAPGANILSTIPKDNYGVKTGSSMATPLVSGAAALVLSVLGSKDGNYFQATRVKNILMESGDTRQGLAVASQRILNAARAVQSAMSVTGTGSLLLVPMTVNVSEASGVLTRAFSEAYFRISPTARDALAATPANSTVPSPALSVLGLKPIATGARSSAAPTLRGFKYVGDDVVVATRAQLLLQNRGVYGLNLVTTAPLSRVAVTVGQRQVTSWNATSTRNTWLAVLQVDDAPAWYEFEILYNNAGNQTVELRWSWPGQTSFNFLPDGWVFSGSMAPALPLPYMPRDLPTASNSPASEAAVGPGGWNVLWGVMPPPSPSEMEPGLTAVADMAGLRVFNPNFLASLSSDQQYPYSVFLDELNLATNVTLAAALAGGAANPRLADAGAVAAAASGPVYGIATTFIQSPSDAPLTVAFRVTCVHCAVYIDGVLFHETLDASYVPGSATPPATTTRITPCITLDPVRTKDTANAAYRPRHRLQVRFAARTLVANASLLVQQATCTQNQAVPSTFSNVADIAAPSPWYRAAGAPSTNASGSIQCDMWDSEVIGGFISSELGNIPRPEDKAPVARFRLPNSRAGYFPCYPPGSFCPSGLNFSTKVSDIIPVAQLPDYLYIRCWAWWSRGFSNGQLGIHSADSLTLSVYLGGQQVFQSLSYGDMTPFSKQSRAPNVTMMGGNYRQLVAFEWHLVSPYTRLRVADGVVTMPADGRSMIVDGSFSAPR